MLSDGASENDFFKISSFFDEGLWRIAMCNADDVLFDDGAGVEFGGDDRRVAAARSERRLRPRARHFRARHQLSLRVLLPLLLG